MASPTLSTHPTNQRQWLYPVMALAAVIAIAHLPLLWKLGRRLWHTEHYQHFPLVIVAAGLLVYWRVKERGNVAPGHWFLRLAMTMTSLSLLALAVLVNSPWLAGISAMTSLLAICYVLGGFKLTFSLLPVWLFLWLAVPPPLGLDMQLILWLQKLATACASGLLDLCGFHHLVSGVVIQLPGRSFMVEEACSGINSLFAVLSCTVFYLILCQRHFVRSLVLILAAILWVLICNAARVTLVTVLSTKWDLPVAEGIGHDIVGVIMFVVCIGLICSTDQFCMFLVPPGWIPKLFASWRKWGERSSRRRKWFLFGKSTKRQATEEKNDPIEPQPANNDPKRYRLFDAYALLAAFAIVGLLQLFWNNDFAQAHKVHESADFSRFGETLLPSDLQGWKRTQFEQVTRDEEDPNGQYSHQWHYEKDDQVLVLSVDGPFIGWHNLASCLEGQGWLLDSSDNREYESTAETTPGGYTEIQASKGIGEKAYVLFGVFDEQNRALAPAETYLEFRAVRRFPQLSDLLKRVTGASETETRDTDRTFQIQLFQPSAVTLTADEMADARALFLAARELITKSGSSTSDDE